MQVKAPGIIPITVEIEYSGAATEGDVQLVAEAYIHDLGIGGHFAKRDLYERYKDIDVKTIEILAPVRDVQPDITGIIVIYSIAVTRTAL